MPIFTFANNINTTLASPVSNSATTITLASTANLPATIPAGQVLAITINDASTRQNYEVMYATARAGATLTVLRGQEGTSALAWLTGDFAYSPPTAGQQSAFGQIAANNEWSGQNTFDQSVAVSGSVTTSQGFLVPNNVPYYAYSTSGPYSVMYVDASNLVNVGNSNYPLALRGASGGNVFGLGQSLQAVARSYNTNYTNNTNAPIMVTAQTTSTGTGSIGIFINSVEFTNSSATSSGTALCVWAIVPPGAIYQFGTTGSISGTASFYEYR